MGQQHDFYLVQSGNLVPRSAHWRDFLACFQQPSPLRSANLDSSDFGDSAASKDFTEAAKWYRKAAEYGKVVGQYALGVMYANGEGIPQDYIQAHKWLNLAASKAEAKDAEEYRSARDRLAEKMARSQIAEAQRLARDWKPKTCEELESKD